MKKTAILIAVLALTITAAADNRSKQQTQQIAGTQLGASQVRLVEEMPMIDVYESLTGEGFVVVSRDDHFNAVLGYSETAFPAGGRMPCGLRWWMQAVDRRMQEARANGYEGLPQPSRPAPRKAKMVVDNFVTARWGQDTPYNLLCPLVSNVETPSGCVATAMAQILHYFKYPEQGIGTGSYTTTGSRATTESVGHTYDWGNMVNYYTSASREEQKMAVAELMYDAGLSCKMSYSPGGSGAYEYDAAAGFVDNFQYDPYALRYCYRDIYTDEDWAYMVETELKARRPILYCGADLQEQVGHAFVFSGLADDGMVYVNWGWDGDGNGLYSFDELTPKVGVERSDYGSYNAQQSMLIGFRPQAEPDADESFRSEWGVTGTLDKASVTNNKLVYSYTATNFHFRSFKGKLGLLFESFWNEKRYYLLGTKNVNNTGTLRDSRGTLTADVTDLPAGIYNVYMASLDNREEVPQKMRRYNHGDIPTVMVCKLADGTLVLGDGSAAIRGVEATPAEEAPVSAYDATGRLLRQWPAGTFDRQQLPPTPGIVILRQGQHTWKLNP